MKTKKIGVILTAAVVASSMLIGCNNTSAETSTGQNESINKPVEQKEEEKTPPILIEDLVLDISIRKPDSIGTVYMDAVLTNNSNKPIKHCTITVLLKDQNEKTYLTFVDTIMPKEKSSKTDAFAPKTQKKEDIEILKYEITIAGEDGKDIYLDYDPKLKQYEWF